MSDPALLAALADIPERPARDPRRLRALQELCVQRLATLGVSAAVEVLVEGRYREKRWDVATVGSAPSIAISARSYMASRSNAAVNRLDDLLAEAANVHRRQPSAVLGFLGVIATDQPGRRGAATSLWNAERIAAKTGRVCARPGSDSHPELFEAGCLLGVDFAVHDVQALQAPGLLPFDEWLHRLVDLQVQRQGVRRLCERRHARRRDSVVVGRFQ